MTWDAIRPIIRREYIARARTKSFAVMTILIPLLMGGSILLPVLIGRHEADVQRRVAIADETGSLADSLRAALAEPLADGRPRYLVESVDTDSFGLASARLMVRAGAFDALVVIPADIFASGRATYLTSRGPNFLEIRAVQEALRRQVTAFRLARSGLEPAEIRAVIAGVRLEPVVMRPEGGEQNVETVFLGSTIIMMLMYFSLVLYGTWTMRGVLTDKTSRIVEILVSTVSTTDLMIGKIVGIGAVGLTQVFIWLAFSTVATAFPESAAGRFIASLSAGFVVAFLLLYLTGFLLYATLYAGVGALASSEEDAQQLQWPILVLLMVPAFLLGIAVTQPDRTLVVALSYVPFFAPVIMLLRFTAGSAGWTELLAALGIIAATTVLIARVIGRLFRVGILMTGKRPTVREIARWFREA